MSLSNVSIRRMLLQDLERVLEIDRLSFSLPWPRRTFLFELQENELARCWVAEIDHAEFSGPVVGMAVVWQVVDEAHIATIAVHPHYRSQGIGRKLLATILKHAQRNGMASATLEVRETNDIAQTMYRKFGFEVKGRRSHYYHDTNEDALIMTLTFSEKSIDLEEKHES